MKPLNPGPRWADMDGPNHTLHAMEMSSWSLETLISCCVSKRRAPGAAGSWTLRDLSLFLSHPQGDGSAHAVVLCGVL